MTEFNGKKIFECGLAEGNACRREYRDSVFAYIDRKYKESIENRDAFMSDIVGNQENYRKKFIGMLGSPDYPCGTPLAKTVHIGFDDFCNVYRLQIEVMPDFWFYGILMVPHGACNAPLVIAQHGGGSLPEICSDFLGKSNYGFFTKRALERGMVVFAPQLLLWKFDTENCEKKINIDVKYDRSDVDKKLKHLGLSITGLEVFCIRRSIDYLHSLEYVDEHRSGMMGLSYGGYFSLYTAAADTRIKSCYCAGAFNDRTKVAFDGWRYPDSANTFCDAETAALVAPRRLQIDVGINDPVFDYAPSVSEAKRAGKYYGAFDASENLRYNLWDGGHRFDDSGKGFDFFFEGI